MQSTDKILPIIYFFSKEKDTEIYRNSIKRSKSLNENEQSVLDILNNNKLVPIKVVKGMDLESDSTERLAKWFANLIEKCFIFLREMSKEFPELKGFYKNKRPNCDYFQLISKELNTNGWHDDVSIIDMVVDISFNIVQKHVLQDVNKRTSAIFVGVFLKICGFIVPFFDVKNSKYNQKDFLKSFKEQTKEFANCNISNEEEVIKKKEKMKEYLKRNLMIDFIYVRKMTKQFKNVDSSKIKYVFLKEVEKNNLKEFFDDNFYEDSYIFKIF